MHKGIKEYQENQRRQDRLNKTSQDKDLAKQIFAWLQAQKDNTNGQ